MQQQSSNNEKCQCAKKLTAFDKALKELKSEVEKQRKIIEVVKKSLKRQGAKKMYQQNNNLNATLQNILNAKRSGKNPQMLMNNLLQQNPQMQQTLTQLKNMVGNRNPKEFFMQMAKQNGVQETTFALIDELFNN